MIIASDLEGTLTTGATWKGLGAYLRQSDRRLPYNIFFASKLPAAIMYRLGLIDGERFKNQWMAQVLGFFRAYTVEQFEQVAEQVVAEELWPQRRPEVLAELHAYLEEGHEVILTTGTLTPVARRFADRAGIPHVIATDIETRDGVLTGRVEGVRNTGEDKLRGIKQVVDGAQLAAAYGDTLPDLPMLEAAERPVAVHPDRKLARIADERGWRVIRASD